MQRWKKCSPIILDKWREHPTWDSESLIEVEIPEIGKQLPDTEEYFYLGKREQNSKNV